MPKILSKSKYCNGLQCPKLLWVQYNDKARLPVWGASAQAPFDEGHRVGEQACSLYPDGIEIKFRPDAFAEMIAETQEALKLRRPIFEATFSHDNAYAQADILVPVGDDEWDVFEVKSSTWVKEVYLHDLSFQLRLYESVGLKINRCFIMHINNQYLRRGELDVDALFTRADVTDQVRELSAAVRGRMDGMLETIALSDCPKVSVGPHCRDPYKCPLVPECWSFLPEHPIGELYRFPAKKTDELRENGINAIEELPQDYPLNDKQAIQRATLLSGEPHVDREAIQRFLDGLTFPQYHLDFETFQLAIPAYDNSKPYALTPFQFSLHVWHSFDSEPEHHEFLADGTGDPRKEMLERLQPLIGPAGDIVAYNMPFEISRLKESAEAFPDYQAFVNGLLPRFIDLLMPFRAFDYYHPKQVSAARTGVATDLPTAHVRRDGRSIRVGAPGVRVAA